MVPTAREGRSCCSARESQMKLTHKTNAYATHQPVLIDVIERVKPQVVLELGCGMGSTYLLHEMAHRIGFRLFTVESDLEWYGKFRNSMQDSKHAWLYSSDVERMELDGDTLEALDMMDGASPDIVFIDQGSWASRQASINHWRDVAQFLIVHDADVYSHEQAHFKWNRMFYIPNNVGVGELPEYHGGAVYGPPTLVLSNFAPCNFAPDWNRDEY